DGVGAEGCDPLVHGVRLQAGEERSPGVALRPALRARPVTARPRHSRGACLCGAVKFHFRGPLRPTVTACHCRTCRKFSGGLLASVAAWRKDLVLDKARSLKWYRSSRWARRGFCGQCGSSLFWMPDRGPVMTIAAGALTEPTGLRLATHGWTRYSAD